MFWKNHPRALPFLFFSEMWERFGYYLMIGIFTLYLKDVEKGFAMTEAESADLYGTFIALVFLTPFIGGLVADRYLGYSKSIIFGGLCMSLGYFLIGIHSYFYLYLGMFLVIVGNGFFKPNISTLLGNIYSTPEHVHQKDEGYNIFYMGMNIGAFICNFLGAALQILLGWQYAFMAAGVGMLIGVAVYIIGLKNYKAYDTIKGVGPGDMSLTRIVLLILVPSFVAAILGWMIPNNLFGSDSTDAFIFACIPVVYFYSSLYTNATVDEKRPIGALLSIFAVVVVFWAVFKQNGSALNTWADRYTDRSIEGNSEKFWASINNAKELTYAKDSVALYDENFVLQKADGKPIKEVNYPLYFRNDSRTATLKDGDVVSVWPANLSQSINPGWVILLTPLVVAFFHYLARRKKEPSTPTKIFFGLIISALSTLVMVAAVKAGANGSEKVSWWWLAASYGVITIGELLLSPMGLSIVSKLSPVRITSLMMGGWFLATSIGNKLSGVLASMWDKYTDKSHFFLVNFGLLILAAFLMFLMLGKLNKVMKEKNIH